jgi:hypothetical protein
MKFVLPSTVVAALAIAALTNLPAHAQTATPPPPPPAPTATPAPKTDSATINVGGRKTPATPAPPKDTDENRVGISGVWEVAIQGPTGVTYTHFKLTQTGTVLTGTYLDGSGKKFPISGTISGKDVRLIVTMPNAAPLLFSGTEDGGTDMVGTIDNSKDVIGFTAEYRPKYKWIDNLTPGTGGLGNPGGVPQ